MWKVRQNRKFPLRRSILPSTQHEAIEKCLFRQHPAANSSDLFVQNLKFDLSISVAARVVLPQIYSPKEIV